MKNIKAYEDLLCYVNSTYDCLLKNFDSSSFLITGGTGALLSFMVDSFLSRKSFHGNLFLYVRSKERAMTRFDAFKEDKRLAFFNFGDKPLFPCHIDYVIHGLSPADPANYAKDPVGVIDVNVLLTKSLLQQSLAINEERTMPKFLLLLSSDIYGNVTGESIKEDNPGSVDPLKIRSCYNEGKRCSETYCVCYNHQYGIPTYMARICHAYGPTLKPTDSKAISQFLCKGLKG